MLRSRPPTWTARTLGLWKARAVTELARGTQQAVGDVLGPGTGEVVAWETRVLHPTALHTEGARLALVACKKWMAQGEWMAQGKWTAQGKCMEINVWHKLNGATL